MSFAINPSLSYIDVPEESIQEIYRSTMAIQLHDSGFRGHNCEAYICICKDETEIRAYIALLETVMKTIFVYSSDLVGKTQADYPRIAAEAQEYLQKLGFTMERVNLEFSKAMREVIIKGIRVMRPPAKKPVARQTTRASQAITVKLEQPRQAEAELETPQGEEITGEIVRLKAELSSARSAIEKVTREKVSLETAAVREMASLKAAAIRSAEALQAAEERHIKEIKALIEENNSLRTPPPDLEKDELKRSVAATAAIQQELNKTVEDLKQSLAASEANNRALEQSQTEEAAAAQAEIARLKAENELLGSNLTAEQAANISAMDKITALALFENSWKEGLLREEELCRNLDIMQVQVEELQAAADAARQTIVELRQQVADLEAELETTRSEAGGQRAAEQMQEHAAAELITLTAAKNDVEQEYIRLATESRAREEELLEALYAADEEILRLNRELEINGNVAAAEQEALRAELKQMIAAGTVTVATFASPAIASTSVGVIESPAVTPVAVITKPETASSALPDTGRAEVQTPALAPQKSEAQEIAQEVFFDDDLAAPLARDTNLTSGLVNEFGSFCGSSGSAATEFCVTPSMDCIEYSSPGEVAALLYSSNSVQAMPDGKKADRCKAFAVVLNRSGKYSVYIAWYMPESKRTVVCSPDHQPVDVADCTAVLQDAVAYFEIVGFMMEIEDLGDNVGSCLKVLHKTPALKRVTPPC